MINSISNHDNIEMFVQHYQNHCLKMSEYDRKDIIFVSMCKRLGQESLKKKLI